MDISTRLHKITRGWNKHSKYSSIQNSFYCDCNPSL